ncbi:hypothetical protein BJP36_02130 [Moorena producens JHB]|uniref:Uncharacterized protein n=1 Tax=Moorena producens (strain JHB) TaxID=1454205 RepID=A0A1D9FUA7_MOOP1|nr:hypothetical protein [Moorena producens]AOY78873.1 hypothetical protein BJP36_02130 [Moorena producens JHB]
MLDKCNVWLSFIKRLVTQDQQWGYPLKPGQGRVFSKWLRVLVMSKDSAQLPITAYRLPVNVLRQACRPSCDRTEGNSFH